MTGHRGYPGTRNDIARRKSYLLGYLALEGPGNRGTEGTPRGVAIGLSKIADCAPKPSLGLSAPSPVDV